MFHNVKLFQVIVVYYLQYIVHVKNLSDQDEQYLVKPFLFYLQCISSGFLHHNIELLEASSFLNGLDLYTYHRSPVTVVMKSDLLVEYLKVYHLYKSN